MRSLIQKVLSESMIIYIKNSNHNTNLKEIKKGYYKRCRKIEKGYSLKTQHEQQNGVVHASYSELQLEELETIAAAIWLPLYRTFTDKWGNEQKEVYDYIWK